MTHDDAPVCFVVAAEFGSTGRAVEMVRDGRSVHLLVCGDEAELPAELVAAGVIVHRLEELPGPPGDQVQRYGGDDPTVVLGERAQVALEALHAEHDFGLIEFVDGAIAMRSVQSKRGGAAFLDVPLGVRLHAPAFHRRAEELRMLGAPRELKRDFCERYAFDGADLQSADSEELLSAAATRAWQVRRDREDPPAYRSSGPAGGAATITIVVAHYNHERYLEAALASLAAQTRAPDEVIVIDDGSTSAAALEVFAAQKARYPRWRFIRQENAGPGMTRNRGLELASGTYFLPFDSDNIAVETMVERLVDAMDRNSDRAATACHNLGFTEDGDIPAGRFLSRYSPTGGPLVLAAVENVFGDTCSIFRTEALRSVGGFETNVWSPTEDWETFSKIASRGLEVDVLPLPLFYYRTEAGGRLQHLGTDRSSRLRLRAHLLDEFFAQAKLGERDRRELFGALQSFEDFVGSVADRFAEQRQWHDAQMADLDAFREQQVQKVQTELGARADAADAQAAAERARAEAAERELAALREATSGPLFGRVVRWRTK